MKLSEMKKMRSYRCSQFRNRNYCSFCYVRTRRNVSRRCFVSIISASRHRNSDRKTATRFALFVDLSLSLLPVCPSSSPFFTFSFAVCFHRHGDRCKSRFTVACHKGCFVAKAARGRQGEDGRESMRMKDVREEGRSGRKSGPNSG